MFLWYLVEVFLLGNFVQVAYTRGKQFDTLYSKSWWNIFCYIMLQILNSSGKALLVAEDAAWSEM